MPGLSFNRLPATGPMAQQAEQEYRSARDAAGQEELIEARALGEQFLTPEQYQNKMAQLRGKHRLRALKMNREWNQRMTMIQQYEKLGAAGTMDPGRASQEQFALSGYDVPARKKSDLWSEHRNLVQERERMEQMLDPWGRKKSWREKGEGTWTRIESVYPSRHKKAGEIKEWGEKATLEEIRQIEAMQGMISQLDQYEFALLSQMNPQQRKINQLSRAMAMGPRVSATPGVGGKRPRILLGAGTPEDPFRGYAADGQKRKQERFETPGYKMTREKAVTQARTQLGSQASKERVLTLAKQIYEAK